jgi:hypothetical protein
MTTDEVNDDLGLAKLAKFKPSTKVPNRIRLPQPTLRDPKTGKFKSLKTKKR